MNPSLCYEHLEKTMPNIASVLRDEISRLARKEIREQTNILKKTSARYRKDIAEMKRKVSDLQRKVALLEKQVPKDASSQATETEGERVRFSAKGLLSQRKRLGLSAAECGKLVGVSGQTIYNWEGGISRPRKQQVAGIASLRGMGKREARAHLEQRGDGRQKRPK